jgi:hypothetical protein
MDDVDEVIATHESQFAKELHVCKATVFARSWLRLRGRMSCTCDWFISKDAAIDLSSAIVKAESLARASIFAHGCRI